MAFGSLSAISRCFDDWVGLNCTRILTHSGNETGRPAQSCTLVISMLTLQTMTADDEASVRLLQFIGLSGGSSGGGLKDRKATTARRPGAEILLRLAGVKPNSDAMRIMISACRLAIARYGDWIGKPCGDLIMAPYFSICAVASAHSA